LCEGEVRYKNLSLLLDWLFLQPIKVMQTNSVTGHRHSMAQATAASPIKIVAKMISYIFHPVFVPLYVVWFLAFVHPYMYVGFHPVLKKTAVMGAAFMAFTFFPLITVLLLKGLKFIDSIQLHTQKDRIIPLIACMMWYFWLWYIWKNFGKTPNAIDMPVEAVRFAFASFFSTIVALMANIKMKISLHAIAMGVMLCFICLIAYHQEVNFGSYLTIAFIVTGTVCTARLLASNHTNTEVYCGLLAGAASMLVGWWWM
jgi:hypothetical protein